ncbi:bacteriohemerythrin [Geobacter sp. OR-1]|uniref:bacteriohemerythrin n=1 Tax=Geobacter sp. OR-1 TaxID=1266765 RepID=UPI0005428F34|nr:bacteriohemerythrin [Geobacter sp. OR-1]GAM10874.1 bacteriohemerythrin [Geobacter sp. OR-1]
MRIVEWEQRFSLGINHIDKHHRHLLELLNMAYRAFTESRDINDARCLFHELLAYAEYHFAAEEELMQRYEYTGSAAHVAEHEKFRVTVNELLGRFLSSAQQYNVEVIYFLEEWLINHILFVDKEFAAAVIAKGYER